MLVLSRQKDESIIIQTAGNIIEITIVDFRGTTPHPAARIGITAPREIVVHRKEVWEAIQKDKLREQKEEAQQQQQTPEDFKKGFLGDYR